MRLVALACAMACTLFSASAAGGAVAADAGEAPDVAAAVDAERELYVLIDGALVKTTETCVAGEASLTCHDGEYQTLLAYDVGWVEFPLPDGALVDVVPRGYWILTDHVATPADDVAAEYSTLPVSTDELIALATEPASPWPAGVFGVGWGYIVALLAVLAVAAAGAWWAIRRRVGNRP